MFKLVERNCKTKVFYYCRKFTYWQRIIRNIWTITAVNAFVATAPIIPPIKPASIGEQFFNIFILHYPFRLWYNVFNIFFMAATSFCGRVAAAFYVAHIIFLSTHTDFFARILVFPVCNTFFFRRSDNAAHYFCETLPLLCAVMNSLIFLSLVSN